MNQTLNTVHLLVGLILFIRSDKNLNFFASISLKKGLNLKHLWQLPSGMQCCRDETILTMEASSWNISACLSDMLSHLRRVNSIRKCNLTFKKFTWNIQVNMNFTCQRYIYFNHIMIHFLHQTKKAVILVWTSHSFLKS